MQSVVRLMVAMLLMGACNEQVSDKQESLFNQLEPFYRDTVFKEFFAFPDTSPYSGKYIYKGKQLDSSIFSRLNEKMTDGLDVSLGFYGVCRFNIDDERIGFITRVPGEYESSAIELWVFDKKSDVFVNKLFLADLFGDAGEMQITNSYLFYDKMNSLNSAYSVYWSYDNSIEEEGDSTLEEVWDYGWLKFEGQTFDTISKDSSRIVSKFKSKFDVMPN